MNFCSPLDFILETKLDATKQINSVHDAQIEKSYNNQRKNNNKETKPRGCPSSGNQHHLFCQKIGLAAPLRDTTTIRQQSLL